MVVCSSRDEATTPINASTPVLLMPVVERRNVSFAQNQAGRIPFDADAKTLDGNKQ